MHPICEELKQRLEWVDRNDPVAESRLKKIFVTKLKRHFDLDLYWNCSVYHISDTHETYNFTKTIPPYGDISMRIFIEKEKLTIETRDDCHSEWMEWKDGYLFTTSDNTDFVSKIDHICSTFVK